MQLNVIRTELAACCRRWQAANGNPALADLYIDTMDALDAINDNAIYFVEVSTPGLHGILHSHCGSALRMLHQAKVCFIWPTCWRQT